MAALLLVLLLLLAVLPTAFTAMSSTNSAMITNEQSLLHNRYATTSPTTSLSLYYLTNDTTIIFLEGQHSFDREDIVDCQ